MASPTHDLFSSTVRAGTEAVARADTPADSLIAADGSANARAGGGGGSGGAVNPAPSSSSLPRSPSVEDPAERARKQKEWLEEQHAWLKKQKEKQERDLKRAREEAARQEQERSDALRQTDFFTQATASMVEDSMSNLNGGASSSYTMAELRAIGNLAACGSVPTLPTRTRLPVSLSQRSSAILERRGQSRRPKQRYAPFLSQFRRSEVVHQATMSTMSAPGSQMGGSGTPAGSSALLTGTHNFSIQEVSSVGASRVNLARDDTVLRELALLRKKYNSLKKDHKHQKAAIAELEFTNRSQARVLQSQQQALIRHQQRDIKITRVLAALPKEDFERVEPPNGPTFDVHPSVIVDRASVGRRTGKKRLNHISPLDANGTGGSSILLGPDDGSSGATGASGGGSGPLDSGGSSLSGTSFLRNLPGNNFGGGTVFNQRQFLPKQVDERSLASNDKMYRNGKWRSDTLNGLLVLAQTQT